MTYILITTNTNMHDSDEITQYVFKKVFHPKRWYVNYNTVSNEVESITCSGSGEDLQHRKHCIPKAINQFINELKLTNIL